MEGHNEFARHLERAESSIRDSIESVREEVRALGARIAEDEASLAAFETRVANGRAREVETAQAAADDFADHPHFGNLEVFKSRATVVKNYDEGLMKDIEAIRSNIEDMKAQQRVWEATLEAIGRDTGNLKEAA